MDCSEDGSCWSCNPGNRREVRPTAAAERARAAACAAVGADAGPLRSASGAVGWWALAQRAKDAEDKRQWGDYEADEAGQA